MKLHCTPKTCAKYKKVQLGGEAFWHGDGHYIAVSGAPGQAPLLRLRALFQQDMLRGNAMAGRSRPRRVLTPGMTTIAGKSV
jgi:hypothetical protein